MSAHNTPDVRVVSAVAVVAGALFVGLFVLLQSAPMDGAVVVRTQPAGAKVRLDVMGERPSTHESVAQAGAARFEALPRGVKVRATASAPGYEGATAEGEIPPTGGALELAVNLAREAGLVAVRSTPPGAFIFLDDKPSGRAPAALADVKPGRHVVECRLDGYAPARVEIEVKGGDVVPVELALEAMGEPPPVVVEKPVPDGLGRVVLSANLPAAFYVDDQLVGQGHRVWRDLAEGEHKAIARVPGRDQKYKTFTVAEGDTVEIEFAFDEDPMQRKYDANDPTKPLHWIIKGGVSRNEGRYGDGIAMFKKALELDPNDFEAHRQLGRTYPVFKKWDEAIFHAEQYLALNPDAPDAAFEREMIELYKQRKAAGDTQMVMPGDPGQGEYPGSRAKP